jgi:glycosyltransferase involved in cell wall biosynthesis
MSAAAGSVPVGGRIRVLHLILVLGETNSQYNEHCLPALGVRELSICTYFTPRLTPPAGIALFAGNDTLVGFFRSLSNALRGHNYDAIHVHAPQTGTFLTLALVASPRRWKLWRTTVYTVHDSFYDYKPRNKLLMLPALALFRRVVFCSNAAYESLPSVLKRLVERRYRVVQNAADLGRVERAVSATPNVGNRTFTTISVGRLETVKDPLSLLSAFRTVGDGSRLVLIGAGILQQALQREIESAGLANRVELTGLIQRDEVFARCAASDVFISVSRGEGLPVAVMEAMAAGKPVILSDIPPHRELADGAEFIPLVRPGDVDGFARELRRFMGMPASDRAAIGALCQQLVYSRFTIDRMQAGYERIYRELGKSEDRP